MKVKAGSTVNDYVRAMDSEHKPIVVKLRAIINAAAPKAEESIKWGNPWWTQDGYLCCIYTAGDHINLGFSRGAELTDKRDLLEGTGKGMRHIKIRSLEEIDEKTFVAMIRQAAKLNRLAAKEQRSR